MYIWIMLRSIVCFNLLPYTPTTSAVDKNEYQLGKLENGMTVLLVRDPSLTKASFCLGVAAGKKDEPIAIQGAAHLLEHIMAHSSKLGNVVHSGLDTEKRFLPLCYYRFKTMRHGAIYNMHITDRGIERAADVVAKVMAGPLFASTDIAHEIAAIDTEFRLKSHFQDFISMDILADLHTTEGHILQGRWGNMRTLTHPDTAKGVEQFWEENYYGQKMSLVIFSSLPFEEMQTVADKFECIRSNPKIESGCAYRHEYNQEEARGLLASFNPVKDLKLKPDALQYIYRTKAGGHVSLMHINIILPSFKKYDRFVPFELIAHFINKHLELDAKLHLNDLGCVIPQFNNIDDNGEHAKLVFNLVLTAQGVVQYREILGIVLETLRNVNVLEASCPFWICKKRTRFDAITNKYTDDLIEKMCKGALFSEPSDIISGSYLYKAEEIDQELIRDLLSYIADFDNWIVVIMDKDYASGDGDQHCSAENTHYESEKKPSYSPESQCSAPNAIQRVGSLRAIVERKLRRQFLIFQSDLKYACLYLLLLELAGLEVQRALAAENRNTDEKMLIDITVESNRSGCKYTVCFTEEGKIRSLHKAIEQYIEAAKNPRISDAFDTAKAFALYHYLVKGMSSIMTTRLSFRQIDSRIDKQAQADAISSLKNEEIVGMSILDDSYSLCNAVIKKNSCNAAYKLLPISLPDYLVKCKLTESVDRNTGMSIYEPLNDTVACSYFEYEIHNAYTLLCRISDIEHRVLDIETPLSTMYNIFMCHLIERLLRPIFIRNVAQAKLHSYGAIVSAWTFASIGYGSVYFSVPSKSPIEDHYNTIDAFVASGGDVIAKMPPDSYNRTFQAVMDQMDLEKYVKQFACVTSKQRELDAETQAQKCQLWNLMTQKNLVAIYGEALECKKKRFMPSKQSAMRA